MENQLKHPDDLPVWKNNATAKNIYRLLERKKKVGWEDKALG